MAINNWQLALIFLLLWLCWARLLHTAAVKSDTFDEMFHILGGALYWQHDTLAPVAQNPPLIPALIGLPVQLAFQPQLPLDHPTWPTGNWLRIAQAFMWQINSNGRQLLWAGRFTTISLSLLLAALVYRWGRQLFRRSSAGLLALFLVSFDPNLLAHGSLATADLGLAFFLTLAAYLVWRYWQAPTAGRYLLAAVAIGCALAAKFSGLVIVPGMILMAFYRLWGARNSWELGGTRGNSWELKKRTVQVVVEVVGWLLLASLVFLLIYRFDIATLAADFARQREHQLTGHSTYLFGRLSITGWWYYFPVIFAAKTPLPILLLLVTVLVLFVMRRRFDWQLLWPLLIAGGVGAAALISRVNIGYRYLLPALPLLYIFIAYCVLRIPYSEGNTQYAIRNTPFHQILVMLLLLWFGIESLAIHPDYLAYFNQAAGGPDNGWRVAVDSNIDWGQDIQPLGRYLAEAGISSVQAAWLGTAPLAAYGVNGTALPAWPNAPEEMLYSPFYPPRPAPGDYVFSVTQLQGVYLSDPDRFAWFRQRPPDDKVGYSLFVYHVPADGPAANVAIAGIGLASVAPADFEQTFASNDVHLRWYDARTAFLWPAGPGDDRGSWAVVGEGHRPDQSLLQSLYPRPTLTSESGDGLRYDLYQWPSSPVTAALDRATVITNFGWSTEPVVGAADWQAARQPLPGEAVFGDSWQLLGYEMVAEGENGEVILVTYWRIRQPIPAGLKIFVHLLDAAGQVVAQHDGLDVLSAGLQAGDEVAQLHRISLPAEGLPAGPYALQIGLYEAESGVRLTVPTPAGVVDRLLLHSFAPPTP